MLPAMVRKAPPTAGIPFLQPAGPLSSVVMQNPIPALRMPVKVAIVGAPSEKVAAHEAAIAASVDLQQSATDDAAIVAVCHANMEQRMYACEQALERGRMVLCSPPPAASLRHAHKLLAAADAGGGELHWEAGPLFGGFAEAAMAALRTTRQTAYARLQLALPVEHIETDTTGIADSHAFWCLPFLQDCFGPIDTIAAHSRALLRRSSPAEDLVIAHLEFVNGVEATLEIHGLATDGVAMTRLEAFGPQGSVRLERDLYVEQIRGLRCQYQRLRDRSVERLPDEPAPDLRTAVALNRWLRQSARLAKRLHRRELSTQ